MSFKEKLMNFAGYVGLAATEAPDEYTFPEFQSYESNMADLKALWSEIRPQLKHDVDKVAQVDAKLQEMFSAFDAGDKERGREAAWAIYNLKVEKLR